MTTDPTRHELERVHVNEQELARSLVLSYERRLSKFRALAVVVLSWMISHGLLVPNRLVK